MAANENVHAGHRARMRNKLLLHSARVFDTYEILEMLLYYVIPGRDTNPTSKALLSRFTTLDGVLSASEAELMQVSGVGPRVAKFLRAVAEYGVTLTSETERELPETLSDYRGAGKYLLDYFDSLGEPEKSKTVMVCLDNRMNVIKAEVVYELDFSSGAVQNKVFVEIAMRNNAAAVILAHNHPFGVAIPQEGDRATNTYIASSLATCGVVLAEHYVIAGGRYVGFMNHLPTAFAQMPEVNSFIRSKIGGANER